MIQKFGMYYLEQVDRGHFDVFVVNSKQKFLVMCLTTLEVRQLQKAIENELDDDDTEDTVTDRQRHAG